MRSMRALSRWLCAALLIATAAGCTDYSDKTKAEKAEEGVFEITPMAIPSQPATAPGEEPAGGTPAAELAPPAERLSPQEMREREREQQRKESAAPPDAAGPSAGNEPASDTAIQLKNPAETESPAQTPAAIPPNAKVYKFTKDTLIAWEASKRIETHSGGFNVFDGQVIVPDGDITKGQIQITFDIAEGLHSDNVDLTKTIKGAEWFDVAKYPKAQFISAYIKKTDSGYEVAGNLTLKDKTVGIKFPAKITVSDQEIKAEAEFTINRHDWGISAQSGLQAWGDQMVLDEVLLMFDAHAVAE